MAFLQREKPFTRKWFLVYSSIAVGTFLFALGYVLFIIPYNIVPGGVFGISIVLHEATRGVISIWPHGIPIGISALVINILLAATGLKILGPRFGYRTITGFFLASLFIDGLIYFVGDSDPLGLSNEILLSCAFGGVLIGSGLGLILKSKATAGGSDIIAMMITKYNKWPIGQLLIYIDTVIIISGLIVFQDWKMPLYSAIVIFIAGKVVDMIIEGVSYDKMLLIISDKPDLIRDKIVNDLNRGGTFLLGEGMYNGEDKKIIYTVVNRREVSILEDYIHRIDPEAFLSVLNTKELLGQGFKSLNDKFIVKG